MKVPYGYLPRQYDEATAEHIWQKYVKPVVLRGDFTLGEEVREFEFKLSGMLESKYCLGVGNGTDALELAINALGIGPGDEVLVPVNTFIASVAVIATAGATPVYIDSNNKYVIDASKIEEKITDKTKAILPVHFQGQPCEMDEIMAIAKQYNLYVIEDAAQAADASYDGQFCGTFGDFGCISFHPQKNMNCWGDGGAILTQSDTLYDYLWLFRNHGMSSRDTYEFFSRNSRLDTLHAAVLLHDLPGLPRSNDRRREIAFEYDHGFEDINLIKTPPRSKNERHTFHLYMMEVWNRDSLLKHCIYNGVDAKVHYPIPLHLQQCSKGLGYLEGDFPVAEKQAKTMISLPIHPYMTDEEVRYTIDVVRRFYK